MKTWTVKMRGGLQVLSPNGDSVDFPTRKTGALMAILALKQGYAIPRNDLADILWPESSAEKQLVSLRQAIRNLRVALGDDCPILVRRDSCRADPNQIQCPDLAAGSGVLLPEMTEPWFEDLRRAEGAVEPQTLARDSAIWGSYQRQMTAAMGLLEALEWASVNRPRECLRIARSLPELIENAPPHRLAVALDRALAAVRIDDPLYGWGLVSRGMANTLLGRVDAGIEQFEEARSRALTAKDRALYVMSSFYLTAGQILSGRHAEALETIKNAKRLRLEKVDHYAAVRLRHGLGLALCHHGSFRLGLRELWTAHDESEDRTAPYEHAYVTANLAWFEATVGSHSKARSLVAELRDLPAGDSWRLELTAMITVAQCLMLEGKTEESAAMCRQIIEVCATWQTSGIDIYAHEILARLAHDTGDRREAERLMRKVVALRQTCEYGTTAWDRERLGPLVPLLAK